MASAKSAERQYRKNQDQLRERVKEADFRFEFCVKDEAGSGLGGKWGEGDAEMIPYRRVLILRADRFEHAIARVKAFVSEEVLSKK